jgi:hypothetical protein
LEALEHARWRPPDHITIQYTLHNRPSGNPAPSEADIRLTRRLATLDVDLIRIARHIAQKQTEPEFYSFEDRERYDLDGIASKRLRYNPLENDEFLRQDFGRPRE